MTESDKEFLERINHEWLHDCVPCVEDWDRLFALARRGVAVQMAHDDQFTRIQRLEAEVIAAADTIERLRAEEYNYAITCRAIPDEFALEPPDGGEVKPWEAVSEMANTINRLRNALLKLTDHFNHGDKWSGQTRGETIQAVEKFARAALEGRDE